MDYVYAVYKERSFTKAAEKLYISQPSLSLTIKKLEAELGFPIFERTGKETLPTELGKKYIKAIEQVIEIKNGLSSEIDDILNLKKGRVTIGTTIFISSYVLPSILKDFKAKYPDIEINILVEQSTKLEKMLDEGEVDLVVDNVAANSTSLTCIPLFEEKIILGVPKDYEINKKFTAYKASLDEIKSGSFCYEKHPKISIENFAEENFILLKQGNSMRRVANSIFEEADVDIKVALEFDQLITAITYADCSFGICFVTDTVLKYGKEGENLCFYVPKTRKSTRTVYIIHKKNKYISSAVKEFIRFITDEKSI